MKTSIEFNIKLTGELKKFVEENCNGFTTQETYTLNNNTSDKEKLITLARLMKAHIDTLEDNIKVLKNTFTFE